MTAIITLHPDDDVAVAARALAAGEIVGDNLTTVDAVPPAHKVARHAIADGAPIRKYGQVIGFATSAIEAGEHVHEHNLAIGAVERDHAIASAVPPAPTAIEGRSFMGYRRPDGRVGTRNYIAIISTVNCSASVAKYIAEGFDTAWLDDYPNVDGILPLTHKGGCAIQAGGDEHLNLTRTLAGFASHPNIGAYLLVGLGCETASLDYLVEHGGLDDGKPVPMLSIQDSGGTRATVDAGIAALGRLLPAANQVERVAVPASELVVGLECGGSDGNSGITANPVIGAAVDRLVAAGGTAILAETPEIYGAEHLLTRRARAQEVGDKLLERIRWWERYAAFFDATIDNNPTAGNKAGGLTTIYEKSLGAVAKAGTTALEGVYRYAERIDVRGLTFMDSPGFDPASITGMVASGATVVCFSTGRGSCFGCKPSPSVKVASNSATFQRLPDDMDFDAGRVYDGTSVDALGAELFDQWLAVASGNPTASERHGLGEEEFCPWSIGPVF